DAVEATLGATLGRVSDRATLPPPATPAATPAGKRTYDADLDQPLVLLVWKAPPRFSREEIASRFFDTLVEAAADDAVATWGGSAFGGRVGGELAPLTVLAASFDDAKHTDEVVR